MLGYILVVRKVIIQTFKFDIFFNPKTSINCGLLKMLKQNSCGTRVLLLNYITCSQQQKANLALSVIRRASRFILYLHNFTPDVLTMTCPN